MKYKVLAHIDMFEDEVELDDNLTEEEVTEALFEYVSEYLDWGYKEMK